MQHKYRVTLYPGHMLDVWRIKCHTHTVLGRLYLVLTDTWGICLFLYTLWQLPCQQRIMGSGRRVGGRRALRRRDHLLLCLKETLSSGGILSGCWISSEIIFLPAYTHLRLMGFSPFFCPSSTRPHSSGVPNNLKANVASVSQLEYCSPQPWSPCKLQKQVNSQRAIKTNFCPSVVSPLIDVSVPPERQTVLSVR